MSDKMNPRWNKSRPPPVVPVLTSCYPLHPSGFSWLKIGLNAADGFAPIIQITDFSGEGVILNHREAYNMVTGPTWRWIQGVFENPEGKTERQFGAPGMKDHSLIVSTHEASIRVGIVCTERSTFDGADAPIYPEESGVYLCHSTWQVLHDYAEFMFDLSSDLVSTGVNCSDMFDRTVDKLSESIANDKNLQPSRIGDVKYVRGFVRKAGLHSSFPDLKLKCRCYISKVMHELRVFHSLFVAFAVQRRLEELDFSATHEVVTGDLWL